MGFCCFLHLCQIPSLTQVAFKLSLNLVPFWLQKSTKIASQTSKNQHRFFERFFIQFFVPLGPILGPNLGHLGANFRTKIGQPFRGPSLSLLHKTYKHPRVFTTFTHSAVYNFSVKTSLGAYSIILLGFVCTSLFNIPSTSILDRFGTDFGPQNGPKIDPKSIQNRSLIQVWFLLRFVIDI